MNLISKAIFINSHSKEVIVEIAIYKNDVWFEILRRKNASITGVIRVSKDDAIEYYNTELKETKHGLWSISTIYFLI